MGLSLWALCMRITLSSDVDLVLLAGIVALGPYIVDLAALSVTMRMSCE